MPELQGLLKPLQRGADLVAARKSEFNEQAGKAILSAIRTHNASHPRQQRSESTAHNPQGFSTQKE